VTPIDLQEFAVRLKIHGTGLEPEFGEEILRLADRDADTQDYDEIIDAVQSLVPEKLHKKEIWRQFEWLEARLDTLLAIETIISESRERFTMAGIETDKRDGTDDVVAKLVDRLPWEWDL
jgi:hypothetical protein